MKCANCSGAHVANWSRCPKHPTNAKKKGRNNNSKKGPRPNNKTVKKHEVTQAPRPDISKARKFTQNLNYASAVQNLIPQEHVSPPPATTPPTPAPSEEASINAGLLKDLLILIEDTQCVDKQIFCMAFKNSLPALRSASAGVDKTYIIFEACCRLRSSQP
ncbi:hypothetical protein TNIN_435001 [Trichonephila inaurata madagascariensis]|uniref:Uncharacterized protein n=1 Tax=Trichonephila inaurata madagascariensis TaxID=2747483 RepID=A0A8X6XFJ8_9ARAC|nr:hypothetical protein TNIN_435001 [Trichonephila inaurata madagascariensis]